MGGTSSQPDVESGRISIRELTRENSKQQGQIVPLKKSERIRGLTRILSAEQRRQEEKKKFEGDTAHYEENMVLLKQLYKKLDPSITKTSTISSHSSVQLSFKYDARQNTLLVNVICCRDLDAKDLRGKSADPYVKLELTSGNYNAMNRTHMIKHTLNPIYHEIFTFDNLTPSQLSAGQLVVQVWDHDVLDRDDLLGEAIVTLGSMEFSSTQPTHTGWYSLHAETDFGITGDLEISMIHKLPETLLVTVHSASNVMNIHEDGKQPNVFVQLQIPGIQSVYKTEIQSDTVNPVWNAEFEFKVPREELASRYIVFHAIDHNPSSSNHSLGQVVIDLEGSGLTEGHRGSYTLADLKNSDRLRSKWFQQGAVQEFRESLVAHAAFRRPYFLFAQHHGAKMVRVRNRKAGSEAKLRVVNGIPVY